MAENSRLNIWRYPQIKYCVIVIATIIVMGFIVIWYSLPGDARPDNQDQGTPPWSPPTPNLSQYPPSGIEIRTQIRGTDLKIVYSFSYSDTIAENRHLQEELSQRLSEITEHISDVIRGMSDGELAPANIKQFKNRLKAEVNRMLRHGQISNIDIIDYVHIGGVAEDTHAAQEYGQ